MSYLPNSRVLQVVHVQEGDYDSTLAYFPAHSTTPTTSHGKEFMSLAITPKSATSDLYIEVVTQAACSVASQQLSQGLYVDAVTNAIAAGMVGMSNAATNGWTYGTGVIKHKVASGSTTLRTYKVRGGSAPSGKFEFNGASLAYWGSLSASTITITEIEP